MTGKWFPGRDVQGYYVAFLEFENAVPATIVTTATGTSPPTSWCRGREFPIPRR